MKTEKCRAFMFDNYQRCQLITKYGNYSTSTGSSQQIWYREGCCQKMLFEGLLTGVFSHINLEGVWKREADLVNGHPWYQHETTGGALLYMNQARQGFPEGWMT